MSILKRLFGKPETPEPSPIRETLFGDMPMDQWTGSAESQKLEPWSLFFEAQAHFAHGEKRAAIDCWRAVLELDGLESRHYLQAWHFLRQNGNQPPPEIAKQLLGAIIEVSMPNGVDLLAAYADRSARYFNFSGAGVVWEHPDDSLDFLIGQLLEVSGKVAAQIGPWEEERPGPPPRDHVRLNFLTPSGLHFGQGPFAGLSADPMGGPVLQAGTGLMRALMTKSNRLASGQR